MEVNVGLLDRLVRAHRSAHAVSRALWADMQDQERHIAHCRGQLQSAQRRLDEFPRGAPPPGADEGDWRQQRAEAAQHRFAAEDTLRRQLKGSPGAFEQHIAAATAASRADFEVAYAEAQGVVAKAERTWRETVEAQQQAGARAGLFRQTLNEAREWLLGAGHGDLVEGLP